MRIAAASFVWEISWHWSSRQINNSFLFHIIWHSNIQFSAYLPCFHQQIYGPLLVPFLFIHKFFTRRYFNLIKMGVFFYFPSWPHGHRFDVTNTSFSKLRLIENPLGMFITSSCFTLEIPSILLLVHPDYFQDGNNHICILKFSYFLVLRKNPSTTFYFRTEPTKRCILAVYISKDSHPILTKQFQLHSIPYWLRVILAQFQFWTCLFPIIPGVRFPRGIPHSRVHQNEGSSGDDHEG